MIELGQTASPCESQDLEQLIPDIVDLLLVCRVLCLANMLNVCYIA